MRVKVCGNTGVETALVAAEAGADALGFIMAPDTPRTLTPRQAEAIVRRMPRDVDLVGVFVDRPMSEVAEIAAEVGFTAVQLHGRETSAEAIELPLPAIKALRLASESEAGHLDWPPGGIVLVEPHHPTLPGGSGQTFPWEWAADLVLHYRVILSGGLAADNVGDAVRRLHPWGVDASSRLESSSGVKDPDRVRDFVAAARRAELEAERV